MTLLITSTLGVFASGALLGAVGEWLYLTHDARVANGVRDLLPFSERYDEFMQIYVNNLKFDDEYLFAAYRQAKGLIKEYKAPFNPSMLAAEIVVCGKLGLTPSDAFQACWRSKARRKATKQNSI